MEENKMIINRLPMTTWNRLKVNQKTVVLTNSFQDLRLLLAPSDRRGI